jgi:hypothetical protein
VLRARRGAGLEYFHLLSCRIFHATLATNFNVALGQRWLAKEFIWSSISWEPFSADAQQLQSCDVARRAPAVAGRQEGRQRQATI